VNLHASLEKDGSNSKISLSELEFLLQPALKSNAPVPVCDDEAAIVLSPHDKKASCQDKRAQLGKQAKICPLNSLSPTTQLVSGAGEIFKFFENFSRFSSGRRLNGQTMKKIDRRN